MYKMHNKTTWNEKLFVSNPNDWYQWYLIKEGVQHYAINSLLYITKMRENMLECIKCICKLKMYANPIRILSKGYLSISLLPTMKLKKNLNEVKKAIQISSPDYDIIIKKITFVL